MKLLVGLLTFLYLPLLCSADTSKRNSVYGAISYSNNLSVSYINYKNWKNSGFNSFSLQAREQFGYDSTAEKFEHHVRLAADLSYFKFVDSIWQKSTDMLDLNLELVRKNSKVFTTSFALLANTQMISDYETDFIDPSQDPHWKAGFANPMTADLCFGSTLKFWKSSRLNFHYVTLRTRTEPWLTDEEPKQGREHLIGNALLTSEYGFTLNTSIRHNFNNWLRWENNSKWFLNGIGRDQTDVDFRNKFVFKIMKYLNLTLDSKIRYQPKQPYKFQFRNELMLSFCLEKSSG